MVYPFLVKPAPQFQFSDINLKKAGGVFRLASFYNTEFGLFDLFKFIAYQILN